MRFLKLSNISNPPQVVIPLIGVKLFPSGTITVDITSLEESLQWPQYLTDLNWWVSQGKIQLTYSESAGIAPVDRLPDSQSPVMYWLSNTKVEIAAAPGESLAVLVTLPDQIQRSFTHPLFFDITITGEGGRDVGTDRLPNTLYYQYLIPVRGDDMHLAIIGSIQHPSNGPCCPLFKYIGCIKTDEDSNLSLTGTPWV